MSVLIKCMNIPENCMHCDLINFNNDWFRCEVGRKENGRVRNMESEYVKFNFLKTRHPNCPLVQLPEKHGRLIDADKLEKALEKRWNVEDDQDFCNKAVWQELKNAPTVIEAEPYLNISKQEVNE